MRVRLYHAPFFFPLEVVGTFVAQCDHEDDVFDGIELKVFYCTFEVTPFAGALIAVMRFEQYGGVDPAELLRKSD